MVRREEGMYICPYSTLSVRLESIVTTSKIGEKFYTTKNLHLIEAKMKCICGGEMLPEAIKCCPLLLLIDTRYCLKVFYFLLMSVHQNLCI